MRIHYTPCLSSFLFIYVLYILLFCTRFMCVYACVWLVLEKPIFALRPKHWTSYRAIIIIQTQRPGTVSFQVTCAIARVRVRVCAQTAHSFPTPYQHKHTTNIIYTRAYTSTWGRPPIVSVGVPQGPQSPTVG